MRILAVDWGAKRAGLAVCDELGLTVRPLATIHRKPGTSLIDAISAYVADLSVELVVVGVPLRADGSVGDAAARILGFAETLRRQLPCPVDTWNERLTSHAAEEWMRERRIPLKKRSQIIDQIAAAILLEDFLAAMAMRTSVAADAKTEPLPPTPQSDLRPE